MTGQRIEEAALPGVDTSRHDDPPRPHEPQADTRRAAEPVEGNPRLVRATFGNEPLYACDLRREHTGQLPRQDSRRFRPAGDGERLVGFHLDLLGAARPQPLRPCLPHGPKLLKAPDDRLGCGEPTVAMNLEGVCPAPNDDQLLARPVRGTPPAAKHDRSLRPVGERLRPLRREQPCDACLGTRPRNSHYCQGTAAHGREQCHPHRIIAHWPAMAMMARTFQDTFVLPRVHGVSNHG